MAQSFRDMLSNRRFAIPLIALLVICFVGLLLLGIVLILPSLRGDAEPVAEAPPTETVVEPTDTEVPSTPTAMPTDTPTPRPSPTLVPVGTAVESAPGEGTSIAAAETSEAETTAEATTAPGGTAEPTSEGGAGDQATLTPTTAVEDDELAQTGVGWGLILISGVGLAGVAVAARRLRMAG